MQNKKYITCGHVFNVFVNESKVKSECPFGAYGTIDAGQCLNNNSICDSCHNYYERVVRMASVESSVKDRYKEKMLKKVLDENNYRKRNKNKSYLYNDIMLNIEDKGYFASHCQEKISKKNKENNKKEGKTIKLTDIF